MTELGGRQDERDLRASGRSESSLRDHGGGHVERAVFFVEAVRRFDLAHFVARRNVDAQETFDLLLFARRGFDEIEPDRLGRNGGAGTQLEAREALGLRDERAQHVGGSGANR